ncbi:hypothetical protein GOV04_04705 [Candidatus Woesearchaeota archaeon]|nr:hypothetical protein [Candidatus Woesearchaeota archaeon]
MTNDDRNEKNFEAYLEAAIASRDPEMFRKAVSETGSTLDTPIADELSERAKADKMHEQMMQVGFTYNKLEADILEQQPSAYKPLFRGMHNLKIPQPMADIAHPQELTAWLVGATILKEDNKHLTEGGELADAAHVEFQSLVDALSAQGFPQIGNITSHYQNQEDTRRASGGLREKLSELPESVKELFVNAFRVEYRPSKLEDPTNPNAYNSVIVNSTEQTPREIAQKIVARLKGV